MESFQFIVKNEELVVFSKNEIQNESSIIFLSFIP